MNGNYFGAFLKGKRVRRSMSLRGLAVKANIAHTYLMNIETGNKPPPSDNVLEQLERALLLDEKNQQLFYDIATKDKHLHNHSNYYIATDISKYLDNTSAAKQVIREANKLGYSNNF